MIMTRKMNVEVKKEKEIFNPFTDVHFFFLSCVKKIRKRSKRKRKKKERKKKEKKRKKKGKKIWEESETKRTKTKTKICN
jgi:hypothetical protein